MKFERVKGNVPVFSGEYDGRDRTIFGGTEQSNDINQQFTPEFIKGWGIVGKNEFPTLQDFNALGFTHSALIGYLYQSGVAQWVAGADYYTGSIAVQGLDLYVAIQDKPTSQPSSLQGWRLVSPALLNTTGNSTSAPMTQKAVTDALAKKWDIQATTGSGNVARMSEVQKKWDIQKTVGSGKVMLEGAYGVGGNAISTGSSITTVEDRLDNRSGFAINNHDDNYSKYSYCVFLKNSTEGYSGRIEWSHSSYQDIVFSDTNPSRIRKRVIYHDKNTSTDKNNVLHSGTSTPINTLNVSDMSQEVINNDLLTVTSGAVYRALQPKADKTYVNTELNKKITGGNVVQTTGQSTVDVMSQKAYTDLTVGIGQGWVDVTSQRIFNTKYTNLSSKPIQLSITVRAFTSVTCGYKLYVDDVVIARDHGDPGHFWGNVINVIIPSGSSYMLSNDGFVNTQINTWTELR